MILDIETETRGQGLVEITGEVSRQVSRHLSGDGLATLFLRHTSASLLIQENADPTARADLEQWLNRLVPENDPLYTHTLEGPDDMPAHIKAMLNQTSLSIPVQRGQLVLGHWQGIFIWEHRSSHQVRQLVLHLHKDLINGDD